MEKTVDVKPNSSVGDDLIVGVRSIAAEIGMTVRKTQHLVATKRIPTGRLGPNVIAFRSRLRAHFDGLLAEN